MAQSWLTDAYRDTLRQSVCEPSTSYLPSRSVPLHPPRRAEGCGDAGHTCQLTRRQRSGALSRQAQRASRLRAKKKSTAESAGEWAALAYDQEPEDPEVLRAVTEVCNKGLRLMLKGDTFRLEPFKDELSKYGQLFTNKGNMQGALFIYAVYSLADHKLPAQYESLQGQYLEAFTKLFDILEDSGWRIKREGEEDDEEDSNEDFLPDQSAGYFQNVGL